MNQEFLYIIIIIAFGYLLKRVNILQEKDGEVISKIIFKITLPALVLVTFDSVKIETSLFLLPVIVLVYGVVSAILGLLFYKNEERELKGSLMMLSSGYNVGLFAFPLVYAIWGMDGLTYFSMFDVGSSFIVFGISYILGSYFSEDGLNLNPIEILKKLGKSIPLMTYMIASIFNFCHIKLPDLIINMASTISGANIPLSLLLLGLFLNFKFDKQFIKPMVKFLAFRYGLGLSVGLVLYYLLPYNIMLRTTIMIGLLLPVPASALTYAVEFKYSNDSTRFVATMSNLTIVISIIILYIFANFIL